MNQINSNFKLLVLSFYFPPSKEVGGRRWAKHVKSLFKFGVETYVLAGDFFNSKSSWDKDIVSYKDRITRVKLTKSELPFFLTRLPQGFFEKIKWKVSLYLWRIRVLFFKGNFNDCSRDSINDFYLKACEIIKEKNITIIIVSVGPFSYSKIIVKIKKKFPDIKIIIDYRDYWEDSLSGLNIFQSRFEIKLQNNVLKNTNAILVPNDEMVSFYKTKLFQKNVYMLPHCYDEDEIGTYIEEFIFPKKSLKILYGGAFYKNIIENIQLIKTFIDDINKDIPTIAEFYVTIKGYEKEIEHPLINRYSAIDASDYFNIVKNVDFVIIILAPDRVNAQTTKFFELVALRKPILYFGGKGKVSSFIEENELGFHITTDNLIQQKQKILKNVVNRKIPNKNYNVRQHSFDYETKKLLDTFLNKI